MNDLISVIVPVYNVEKYLKRCIESIVNQTYKNIEIILIDDGSTDLSGKICDDYAKNNKKINVIHSENYGVSVARNKGLEIFNGTYVIFVDADDILLDDAVETLYTSIIQTKTDMCIGGIIIKKDGISTKHSKKKKDKIKVLNCQKDILDCILDDRFYSCYGKIIKRTIAKQIRFVEKRKIHEDGFFVFQCLLLCKSVAINNRDIYVYLFRADSACHEAFSKKFYDILYFKKRKIDRIKELYPEKEGMINQIAFKHDLALLNKMASCDSGYSLKEIMDIRRSVINEKKYMYIKSIKERIRIFLISYFFKVYLKIMQRNNK